MKKHPWITAGIAVTLLVMSGLTYRAGTAWLPSILMFVAALLITGLAMLLEDGLLKKYDTPHDEEAHPPVLILFRFLRAAVLVVLGILIFWLAF